MEKEMSDTSLQQRHADRRVCSPIAPPPYETRDGIVLCDRRSTFDRRASWIREFFLETLPGSDS